tara:strand:- start:144 stop:1004 length:861 start_codon:yes stop_codon:yes gene_type:complete
MNLEKLELELEQEKTSLINLEYEQKNFSEFNDYFNSIFENNLNIRFTAIKMASKNLEFSFFDCNKGFNTYFHTSARFNIIIKEDNLDFHLDFSCNSTNKIHIKKQSEQLNLLNKLFDLIEFQEFNKLFNNYTSLHEKIKKQRQKVRRIENKYYELSYQRDKKSIENNLLKVSKEENEKKIESWLSNQSLFESKFITYFYKKNEIWFEKINVAGSFDKEEYIFTVNGKVANEKELLKILNNTFRINNDIVYNYDFLKEKKSKNGLDVEIDIREFAKLFIIKDNIKNF